MNWPSHSQNRDPIEALSIDDRRKIRRIEIGANVRRARERSGWTQQQVASILGYSRSHIHRVEQGLTELNFTDMEILAERFHVTLKVLIEGPVDEWESYR